MDVIKLVRKNILELTPYSTARDECKQEMDIYLDANESPYKNGVNRYPSPTQDKLKRRLGLIKNIKSENLFLGNGSDEAIDLIYRIFCTPSKSNVIIISPSYGMYSVCAKINDIDIIYENLSDNFSLDSDSLLKKVNKDTKAIFLCSPNNPTGNCLDNKEIIKILNEFNGIVVVDEAYIDFSNQESLSKIIYNYSNLIVLQTLSKGYGMAGLRIGLAIGNKEIISIMNTIKYPYNISIINQEEAIKELDDFLKINERISSIKEERERVSKLLTTSKEVNRVYPSQGNFILVDFKEKDKIFNLLKENGIIVRDRSSLFNCSNCLRISIGTKDENNKLLEVLNIKHDTSKIINNDRVALINRKSNETNINIKLNLDKFSKPSINTGLHFFNHMLEQIGYHSGISLNILCDGDLEVDEHHTIEDVAIVLGDALLQALGTKENIER